MALAPAQLQGAAPGVVTTCGTGGSYASLGTVAASWRSCYQENICEAIKSCEFWFGLMVGRFESDIGGQKPALCFSLCTISLTPAHGWEIFGGFALAPHPPTQSHI